MLSLGGVKTWVMPDMRVSEKKNVNFWARLNVKYC